MNIQYDFKCLNEKAIINKRINEWDKKFGVISADTMFTNVASLKCLLKCLLQRQKRGGQHA